LEGDGQPQTWARGKTKKGTLKRGGNNNEEVAKWGKKNSLLNEYFKNYAWENGQGTFVLKGRARGRGKGRDIRSFARKFKV
jgi:hypothetical protein